MLKIGGLQFGFPVIQAALSGYSDAPMRRIARKFGASMALCEVFLDQFVLNVSKRSKAKLYLEVRETDHPCGAQLMGSSPDEFVLAAKKLLEFGFDLIDLNFACPVRKVVGKSRGGYLLSDIDCALRIAEAVRRTVPDSVPLTVKLRKGFDSTEESREKFYRLLDGLLSLGITGITLHGRTVKQRYEGESDWLFVTEVKRWLVEEKGRSDFPVIGSGDLFSAECCQRRLKESGVDGLALARGVIGNPWLFREVRALLAGQPVPPPPPVSEQAEIFLEHYDLVESLYGERRASTEFRKFAIQYAALHPKSQEIRLQCVCCHKRDDWLDVLHRFY